MAYKNTGSISYDKDVNKGSLDIIKEQLKSKNLSRAYIFHGSEPFLIDYYVNELKKLILDNDNQSLNLSSFDNKIDIDDVIDACDTFPIFAEKKLVIVKNSGLFYSKTKKIAATDEEDVPDEENSKPEQSVPSGNRAQEALTDYISDIPQTTCLVFIESNVDKRLKVYKQLAKHGTVLEFNRNKPVYLVPWVIKGMNSLGKRLTDEAAEYLVAISDPDMYTLKNELFKLASYSGSRKEVTIDDVKLLAIPTIKSVIFDLLDAVARKNTPRALTILDDILTLKEPEQKILSMLSKQTGEMLKLKLLMEDKASQTEINQYFQGKHPYAMKVMTEQTRNMSIDYLKMLLTNLMEAEADYKKGLIEPRLALEVLLEKISI